MKKLLSIALCAAAITSFADDPSAEIADLGVTVVTIPANQTNTIIAASFNDVATPANGVSINNLIKTATGLAKDDQLMIIRNGSYQTWKWSGTAWEKPTTVGESSSALDPTTTVTQGEGIWFVRSTATSQVTLVLYGAYASAASATVSAGKWALIGNPTVADFSFDGKGAKGDQIIAVSSGSLKTYLRKSSQWKSTTDGVTFTVGAPTVAPGVGIWYYSASGTTIDWAGTDSLTSKKADNQKN
jgi:uncharacterized protein YaiE (UPF0345 family)